VSRWLALALFGLGLFVVYELVALPLSYYSEFHIEHAFGLSNQTVRTWLVHTLKEWLVGLIFGAILMGGLYGALWYGGSLRWLWVWMGWLGLSIGLARIFPTVILPLFYPCERLDNPSLQQRCEELARGTRLTIKGLFKLGLSKETKKANAMLAGLGASRRVYLSDTLLDAFEEDEIGVVFAHELGHHVHGHIVKGIALSALLGTIIVAVVAALLHSVAGAAPALWAEAIARLPWVLLAVSVIGFALSPLSNAIVRAFERQADTEALRRTRDASAFISAMEKLGRMNLANAEPPAWIEVLFYDHPPLSKRIALAERWKQTEAVERPVSAGG
jgi:STE24 endopeptidase